MNIKKKWLRVEDSNLLHTELSLRYFKHAKFYLVNNASFIYCLFKPFLIVWLWRYCTFSDGSVVRLKYSPWPKYIKYGTIFQKHHVLISTFFSSSNMFCIRLFLANTWKKIGGHLACFLTNRRDKWAWFWDRGQDGDQNTEIHTWKEYNKYQGMR